MLLRLEVLVHETGRKVDECADPAARLIYETCAYMVRIRHWQHPHAPDSVGWPCLADVKKLQPVDDDP